jgi:hypothetical protein
MAQFSYTSPTSNVWDTDQISLNYIYPTLDEVSVLIPGVTINADVSIEVGGSTAYLYKLDDPAVTDGIAGRALSSNTSGNTKIDIILNRSFQVDEVIPRVVTDTISVDVVAPYLVNSTNKIANAWGRKGLLEFIDGGTSAGTSLGAPTKANIYGKIIDEIKNFDIANPNRSVGANYIIVSPSTLALLRQSTEFLQTSATAGLLTDGVIGSLGGLTVVLSKQLETITGADVAGYSTLTNVRFIVGAADAFAAPIVFRDFRVKDSELFFGVKVQAELPYGYKVLDSNRIRFYADVATVQV